MNQQKVEEWIQANPSFWQQFDENKNGELDEPELQHIMQITQEYLDLTDDGEWLWLNAKKKSKGGPVPIEGVPRGSAIYVRPENKDLWIPLQLLTTAESKLEERIGSRLPEQIQLSTLDTIPGWEITESRGIIWGMTVLQQDPRMKSELGKEEAIKEYTKLSVEAREKALDRLVNSALKNGANGIIGIRFDSGGENTVTAYGTGVVAHRNIR